MTVQIGIDPGASGALVAVKDDRIVDYLDMPTIVTGKSRDLDAYAIHAWIVEQGHAHITIEHVQGVQGSGATSAFNFGKGFGVLLGIVVASNRPHTLVRPQRWTKDLAVGSDKGAHRLAAQRLHPDNADLFARVKDDGRADAALLARWGQVWTA